MPLTLPFLYGRLNHPIEGFRMKVYKVYYKDFELKRGELVGMLVERRNDLRGMSPIESGLKWARLTFNHLVKEGKTLFVIPDELKLRIDARWFLHKGVLTREDLFGLRQFAEQAMK